MDVGVRFQRNPDSNGGDIVAFLERQPQSQLYLAHLRGRQDSARNLCADHVNAGLPLAVDAAAQALRTKLVVRDLAGHELFGIGAEQLDVGSNGSVVLGLSLLLEGLCGWLDGFFDGDHDDPYLDRD